MGELHSEVCRRFFESGKWPNLRTLEIELRNHGPLVELLREDEDLVEADELTSRDPHIYLTLEGIRSCPCGRELIDYLIATARIMADLYIQTGGEEKLSSEYLAEELGLDDLELWQLNEVIRRQGWIPSSGGSHGKDGGFSLSISRYALQYEDVSTFAALRDAIEAVREQRNDERAFQARQWPATREDFALDRIVPDENLVFLVHGHDEKNKLRLRQLLESEWGIGTIVLSTEPGRGRTLIEKFEEEAKRVAFAFVLYTPDDTIATSDEKAAYAQARPNVLFEMGWFYGRLGRERVCILYRKGTTIHSDLKGVSRIEFDEDVTHKSHEIFRELKEVGISAVEMTPQT